jgi:hypothetical protein
MTKANVPVTIRAALSRTPAAGGAKVSTRADRQRADDVQEFLRDAVEAVRALQQPTVTDEFGPHGAHRGSKWGRAHARQRGHRAEHHNRCSGAPRHRREDAQETAVEHRHGEEGAAGAVAVDQGRAQGHQEDGRAPKTAMIVPAAA